MSGPQSLVSDIPQLSASLIHISSLLVEILSRLKIWYVDAQLVIRQNIDTEITLWCTFS